MYEFTSEDTFYIKSRGKVFGVPGNQIPEGMWDPVDLTGQFVKIDGTEYKVTGVETFCIMRSPRHPYRQSFGLLVKENT